MTTMDILKRTKSAWPSICNAAAEDKNRILSAMADSLQAECDAILRCNAEDMDAARGHISDVMLDRLYLDKDRIDAMADGIRATVALPDHTGRILAQIATAAGCEMVIANGEKPEVLYDIVVGRRAGTRFLIPHS